MLDNTNDTNANTPANPAIAPVAMTDGRDCVFRVMVGSDFRG
jgi:hypothetical protein